MTTTLEAPPETRCDLCSQPVDLTQPHQSVVRHIERIDGAGYIDIGPSEVLSTLHLVCDAPVVACSCCHDGFATFVELATHRCDAMSAA